MVELVVHKCQSCGSRRIRRSHAHTLWQRAVRTLTPLERYACGKCGYRGWRMRAVPRRDEGAPVLGARPVEARDRRARALFRRVMVRNTLIAILLGGLAALPLLLILRAL